MSAMTPEAVINGAYRAFNARDIDGALQLMADDVVWPNGMQGGAVHGRDGVRAYWRRQWTIVDPKVEPVRIDARPDGRFDVEVHQVVRDVRGTLLADRTIHHVYRIQGGLIAAMEVIE